MISWAKTVNTFYKLFFKKAVKMSASFVIAKVQQNTVNHSFHQTIVSEIQNLLELSLYEEFTVKSLQL